MKAEIMHILKCNAVEKTINGSVESCILSINFTTVVNEIGMMIERDKVIEKIKLIAAIKKATE